MSFTKKTFWNGVGKAWIYGGSRSLTCTADVGGSHFEAIRPRASIRKQLYALLHITEYIELEH